MKRSDNGFTLLEIIFALAILVIGLLGVVSLFPVGLRASKRGGDFTVVTFVAQQQLESIKMAGYDAYKIDGGPAGDGWYRPDGSRTEPPGYPSAIDGSPLPDSFSWAAVVTSTGISNLNQVTLAVYWLDRGNYREENFVTYLADYDLGG